ncbi:MAG TPA: hypothetical protein VG498_15785 [Terriglobales bacterium]|nr:hypothetical protein [Terriglobales bacterium]
MFGIVRVCEGPALDEQKTWFFDRLLERLGDSRGKLLGGLHDAEADHVV